jgi:hypothetical protein
VVDAVNMAKATTEVLKIMRKVVGGLLKGVRG